MTGLLDRLDAVAPGSADGCADQLLAYAATLRTAAGAVAAAPPGWAGAGALASAAARTALQERLRHCADECELLATALRAVGVAAAGYRGEAATARRVLAAESASAGTVPSGAAGAVEAELTAAWGRFERIDAGAAATVTVTLLPRLAPSSSLGVLAPAPGSGTSGVLLAAASAAPPRPDRPAAVTVWWAGLAAGPRAALLTGWDLLLADLDGLPSSVRDELNRGRLARALEAARIAVDRERLPDLARGLAGSAARVLPWPVSTVLASAVSRSPSQARLERLRAVAGVAAEPGRRLLLFDEAAGGRAVISTGEIERASSLAVLVPGMNTDLGDVPRLDDQVARIAEEAGAGAVGVSWLGYDAPGVRQVVSAATARSAVTPLARFTESLRALGPVRQRVTVIGHSYGSLVVGLTARLPAAPAPATLRADEVVFVASPGVGAERAAQLLLPADRVWAGRAGTDPIQLVFWPGKVAGALGLDPITAFGPDPTSAAFGARRLDTGGARGHSSYFDAGTQSLDELGDIVAGRPVRELSSPAAAAGS